MPYHRITAIFARLGALLGLLLLTTACLVQPNGPAVPTLAPLTPTPTSQPLPAATGRIAYRADTGGAGDLWVINADGSNRQQVTQNQNVGGNHSWSPDSTRLLYQADVNTKAQIFVLPIGSDNKPGQATVITSDTPNFDNVNPDWSPDGTQIVYQSKRNGGDYQLFISPANGGAAKQLSGTPAYTGAPNWSADGKTIAFVGGADAQHTDIYTIPAQGGASTQLTNLGVTASRPLWSPDGKAIVFIYLDAGGLHRIATINSDGTGMHDLTDANQEALIPSWSPDGSLLVFHSTTLPATSGPGRTAAESNNEIYVLNKDGSNLVDVSNDRGGDIYAAWGPDGLRLVFSSNRSGPYRLYTVGRDGRNLSELTPAGGDQNESFPAWSK